MVSTLRIIAVFMVTGLAACGVDGEPTPPKVTGSTTVGFNTSSGAFSSTEIGVHFGS